MEPNMNKEYSERFDTLRKKQSRDELSQIRSGENKFWR